MLTSNKLNIWDALTTISHLKNFASIYHGDEEEDQDDYIPFVACGKDEELDSDMNYSLSTKLVPTKRTSPEEIGNVGAGEQHMSAKDYNYLEPR